jgi:large conductance mechanosensitive channel
VKGFRDFISVKGFKDFITRGSLIDLAVAVVIGLAFTAVVTALVTDLITPLIAAIAGKPNFANLKFTVNHSTFLYGSFVNAVLSFLIIAAVIYYLIVAPMSKITVRFQKSAEATTRDCPECLSTIPIAATRCMYCTAQVPPVAPASPVTQ